MKHQIDSDLVEKNTGFLPTHPRVFAGNGYGQHSEWEEGVPESRGGGQGQVGLLELCQRLDTE